MKREVIALSALLMCISPFVSLSAHHGTAAFDNEKKITLKGTVTLNPVKNGLPLGRILTAELPSGKTLDANAGIRGNVYK
ncbi:MAG TPA: hypothetical protein VKW78_07305 [Terriglobales bacterium]|nr:hypothetical protein [Terriglobales bacterium]